MHTRGDVEALEHGKFPHERFKRRMSEATAEQGVLPKPSVVFPMFEDIFYRVHALCIRGRGILYTSAFVFPTPCRENFGRTPLDPVEFPHCGRVRSPPPCCPFQGKYLRQQGKGFQNPSVTATPRQLPYKGSQGGRTSFRTLVRNLVLEIPPPYGRRNDVLRCPSYSAHPPTPLRWRGVCFE